MSFKSLISSSFSDDPAHIWSILLVFSITIVGIALPSSALYSKIDAPEKSNRPSEWSSGGPSENAPENTLSGASGVLLDLQYDQNIEDSSQNQNSSIKDAYLVDSSGPLASAASSENGVIKYKIEKGDTLGEVATRFNVSLETIRWANPSVKNLLRAESELTILPVSGIFYATRSGDSLESVASRFQISPDLIVKYNSDFQKIFDEPGNSVILPYAKPQRGAAVSFAVKSLPNLKNYFILPARGWNWGELHNENAVDIADKCGSPIFASAEGLVMEESSGGYWNQGYGNYILVEHPNGVKTRYAHTEKNLVRVGDYVAQGDKISLIGATGKTHGVTGCHLHFEVLGAQNPFAVK